MAATERGNFLILCKTYPSPSEKYIETSCVAAMREDGTLVRLFPIPFRLLEDTDQFSKWQWIEAVVKKSNDDHRKESYKISIDTIKPKDKVNTKYEWKDRYYWLNKLKHYHNFQDINADQEANSTSLALLKPARIDKLEIAPSSTEWAEADKEKLLKENATADLFSEQSSKLPKKTLRKIPFDFYFHYSCDDGNGGFISCKNKIIDWEIGALFWNCQRHYKANWEIKFRQKIEEDILEKNVFFLVGNMHRFQRQWLIISLIYPPKKLEEQQDLF